MNQPYAQQQIQESGYEYPYHYIPVWERGRFRQHQYWSWGFRYLGGIQIVLNELAKISFESLLDIGCGDGRFLREARRLFPHSRLLGLDYSEQAIRLAQALNAGIRYEARDIISEPLAEQFEAATLVEVLEHIPIADVPSFLSACAAALKPGGHLVLTVPHRNKPIEPKHFQHFNSDQLRTLLMRDFAEVSIVPFDTLSKHAPLLAILERLLGGRGRYFLVTNRHLVSAFFRYYLRRHLYARNERVCGRLLAICRKA